MSTRDRTFIRTVKSTIASLITIILSRAIGSRGRHWFRRPRREQLEYHRQCYDRRNGGLPRWDRDRRGAGRQRIYVVGGSLDFVVIDGSKIDDGMAGNEVVDSLDPLPSGVTSVAVDPPRDRIYVTGRGDTVSVIGTVADEAGVAKCYFGKQLPPFTEDNPRLPNPIARVS